MLKKAFYLFVALTLTLLMTPQKSSAAVLNWEAMVNSTFPAGTHRSPGFDDPHNLYVTSMATFNDYLYVATYNNDQGTEIWRTNNGTAWDQVNSDGFGIHTTSASVLAVFNGQLYAFLSVLLDPASTVAAYRTNNGTTWELAKSNIAPTSPSRWASTATVYNNALYVGLVNKDDEAIVVGSTNGSTWNQVNPDAFGFPNNIAIQSMATFNNMLYVGVLNITDGTQVWHYDGSTWNQDNSNGFDGANPDLNISTGSLSVFEGQLYASTLNDDTGVEVWRTPGDQTWQKVADQGFSQGNSVDVTYDSAVFKDALYVGTFGSKVFRTTNGTTWEQANVDGFGNNDNDVVTFATLGDYLYAGVGHLRMVGTVEIYRYYQPDPAPEPEPTPELPQTGPIY